MPLVPALSAETTSRRWTIGWVWVPSEGGSSLRIDTEFIDPANMAFDHRAGRLLALDSSHERWIDVAVGSEGRLVPDTLRTWDVISLRLENPLGVAIDPNTGEIYVLDSARRWIERIARDRDGAVGGAETGASIDLASVGIWDPMALTLDPASGHLHVLASSGSRLYELRATGQIVAERDVSSLRLLEPRGMSFGPSGDTTDDPAIASLYISHGDDEIVELSFLPPPTPLTPTVTATLVQTINTSQFSPPSPDTSGVVYLPSSDTLLLVDSEVEEMPLYAGANVFETTLTGSLLETFNTLAFSDEPTGVALNPVTGHIFISDDDRVEIFEVDPGPDGQFWTVDDVRTHFDTLIFGSTDPEGVTFDTAGNLFIVDGVNSEVYKISPGANGIFDGVPPDGDDQKTNFDTASLGITDPEGIAFDSDFGHLYIVGVPKTQIAHVSTGGTLLRMIDISAANAIKPAGLAYAPGSQDPLLMNFYITDRGVDNNVDPNENDGKVYEMAPPPNQAPMVSAGSDESVGQPTVLVLDGMATDDGLPSGQPGTLWSQVSGPSSVVFGDPTALNSTASFSSTGTYLLRLTANDGQLLVSDDVMFTVGASASVLDSDFQVMSGSDDAEEAPSGMMNLQSNDLDLGINASGVRFAGLNVPRGSTILGAFVQFQADDTTSIPTSLVIDGHDTGNAPTFSATENDLTQRSRTAANINWAPAPWTVGQLGPAQKTPDLSPIVQEIVNRSDWSSGNALALLLVGTGERHAETYEGAGEAASLHVDYFPPQPIPANMTLDNDVVTTDQLHWACDTITAGPNYHIMAPASVTFRTGHLIALANGFSVESGASFTTQYDPGCTVNTAPTVTITAPANGSVFEFAQNVTFSGTATDPQQGNLTPSLSWSSSLNGNIGSGGSFSTTTLFSGTHTITAKVTDNGYLTGTAQITITVNPNTPPSVSIFAPSDGSVFPVGTSIFFDGSASDAQQGNLSGIMVWTSDIQGLLGTGASFSKMDLSAGLHTIIASVTDNGGATSTDSTEIGVSVAGNVPPRVTIVSPENASTFVETESVQFQGTATDFEDGNLTASLFWTSSRDGPIGNGGSFTIDDLSLGTHTVTASVTDSGGLNRQSQVQLIVSDSVVIVGAGDIADCSSQDDEATANLIDNISGTVVTFGDNVYDDGTASEFANCYDPSWGRHKWRTRAAVGNREYHVAGATPYYDYFGAAAGEADKGYYSFGAGAWHVVVLNSECGQVGGCGPSSPQGLWLQADLAANSTACTLAVMHRPLFASGTSGSDSVRPLWEMLYQAGADLMMTGHVHTYERFAPQDPYGAADAAGIRQFIVGTGGKSTSLLLPPLPNSELRGNEFGVIELTLFATGYDWEFIPVAGGSFTDSGSASCTYPSTPPFVMISSPADGSPLKSGDNVTFTGTADDLEDGPLTGSLQWSSSLDGILFTGGGSFSTTALSNGTHIITASVLDSGGTRGQDTITVTVTNKP
ncbi:MAG TPA: hypothetical protein VLK65_20575 [Vicinamibacteria bacterium]|nr:hypothetical protein [Vicinamibacteria bacterium]